MKIKINGDSYKVDSLIIMLPDGEMKVFVKEVFSVRHRIEIPMRGDNLKILKNMIREKARRIFNV